jgi:hypothetical protein
MHHDTRTARGCAKRGANRRMQSWSSRFLSVFRFLRFFGPVTAVGGGRRQSPVLALPGITPGVLW